MKTIAWEIHEADADYVLALKANHEVLHGEIQTFLDDALENPAHLPDASRHQTVEKDQGRIESRRYLCTGRLDWLGDRHQWAALSSVAVVEAERTIGHQTTRERRYNLNSLPSEAAALAAAIRGHCAKTTAACVAATPPPTSPPFRHIALNLLCNDNTKKRGIRTKQKIATWDHRYLIKLLAF